MDELAAPQPGDIVIVKTRYRELQERGVRYLFFTSIAANVCVESTRRDAFFLDHWPVLITDATMAAGSDIHAGSDAVQQRILYRLDHSLPQ